MLQSTQLVANYIKANNLIAKWGTGADAITTEACFTQRDYIKRKFNITDSQFNEAWEHVMKNNCPVS